MNPSSPPVAAPKVDEFTRHLPHERLNNLELHVFQRIACGQTLTGVARTLGTTVETVEAHKLSILSKMGLPDDDTIVRYALSKRLIADDDF